MNREEAAPKISEYVLGQLDGETAAAVTEQVAADPELQRLEKFLRWLHPRLKDMQNHLPGPHPTGEEIVHAATGQGEISNDRADWVRGHLGQCPECRDLQEKVQAADKDLQLKDKDLQQADRPKGRRNMGFGLAAIVALLVISSSLWVVTRSGNQPTTQDPVQVVQLSGITRGENDLLDIQSADNGQLPTFLLECDPWIGRATADNFTLEINLIDADSGSSMGTWEFSTQDIWSADQTGLLLTLKETRLEAGQYLLEVRDDNRQIIFQTGFDLLPR